MVKYLAEIQRRTKTGFLGTATSIELNVLAVQRGELWSTTSTTLSLTPADEKRFDQSYGNGALVLVETDANNKVLQVDDAKRHVLNILRQMNQLQERLQQVERESEEMQQSLMLQAQEFHRRQMELEERLAQVEQAEEALKGLEEQQQQLQMLQAEVEALQADIQQKEAALSQAWQQLEREREQLQANRAGVLTHDMAQQMLSCVEQLRRVQPAGDSFHRWHELLTQQQRFLDAQQHQSHQAQDQLQSLQERLHQLQPQWSELHRREAELVAQERLAEHLQAECEQLQQRLLVLDRAVQDQEQTCKQMKRLIGASALVDRAALMAMDLEELEREVQDKEQAVHKLQNYLREQEEELRMQQEAIEAIRAKMQQANDYEKIDLESELESEQQNYQFLEASLLGQRETLAEREAIARAYRQILEQRLGRATADDKSSDLEPILQAAEQQLQRLIQERQACQQQFQERQAQLEQLRDRLQQERDACAQYRHALTQQQQEWEQTRQQLEQLTGRINAYQDLLPAQQDYLRQLWECYHQVGQGVGQGQSQVVDELLALMQQVLQS